MEVIKKEEGTGSETGAGTKSESGARPRKIREASTKKSNEVCVVNREQAKFYVDVSDEKESLALIFSLMERSNKKEHGRPITFKDLCLAGLAQLTDKDLERIQESCLTEMEKVNRALIEFNQKNSTSLSLGEFLVRKLGIN